MSGRTDTVATVELVERFELAVAASMRARKAEQLKAAKDEYESARAALLKALGEDGWVNDGFGI